MRIKENMVSGTETDEDQAEVLGQTFVNVHSSTNISDEGRGGNRSQQHRATSEVIDAPFRKTEIRRTYVIKRAIS